MRTVIVTRPAPEARRWVDALAQAGHRAHALPLIEIADAPDPLRLLACRRAVSDFHALMFVSAQAVQRFWAEMDAPPAARVTARCWAPGPGTARALQAVGVPVAQIDAPPESSAQFDSEALWPVVQGQASGGRRLLVVHGVSTSGSGGRDWLARQWQAAGGQVEHCVSYRRLSPVWPATQVAQVAVWARSGGCWLFSSSEAVQHLAALCPGQDWSASHALVTHPRIAQVAQALGFGDIHQTRPALPDVLHSLESWP